MTIPHVTLGIAGGSGAGKTTLSRIVLSKLGDDDVTYLVHDDYYKDLSHMEFSERVKVNFDHPDALDTTLLIEHVQDLKRGRTVRVPNYCFKTHTRLPETTVQIPRKVLLVEGILLFSDPRLIDELDIKVYVDADADIRFIRRLTRDMAERGRSCQSVIAQYELTVRPMHLQYVEPSKRLADLVFQSDRQKQQQQRQKKGGGGDDDDEDDMLDVTIRMILDHLQVRMKNDDAVVVVPSSQSASTITTPTDPSQGKTENNAGGV